MSDSVDSDELWTIETVDVPCDVYTFYGKATPYASAATSKAKQQYATENDVSYDDLTAKKIGSVLGRDKGAIVAVFEDITENAQEAIPF
ncbi:hypothetical protein [Halosegnis longus]|uniref:hypothetical protein n=1 Tax=Halosegnis longus TaxID=2216012 RepID=UPI00129EDD98|nr:hypothetical protein [Halosegnis longus]